MKKMFGVIGLALMLTGCGRTTVNIEETQCVFSEEPWSIQTTLSSKEDVLSSETTRSEYHWVGYTTQEEITMELEELETKYQGISGVKFDWDILETKTTEMLTIDYEVADIHELIALGLFEETENEDVYPSLKESLENLRANGYNCN